MARPLRVEIPGGCYHVFSRGNEKRDIFYASDDYKQFLLLIEKCCGRYDLVIHAYALMKNHYHLLLEIKQPNLSRALHYLNSAYTSYFNRKYNRVGHLFQGRFKSLLVDKDDYLLVLSRYIHLNPVRDGFVSWPQDYPWSSYQVYLGDKKCLWLETKFTLNLFSEDWQRAQEKYRHFVEAEMSAKLLENPFENVVHRCVLGGKDFAEKALSKFQQTMKKAADPEVVDFKSIRGLLPDAVLAAVRNFYHAKNGATFKWIYPNEASQIAIYLLCKHTGLTLQEIASQCGGGHYSRISHIKNKVAEKIENNDILADKVSVIEQSFKIQGLTP